MKGRRSFFRLYRWRDTLGRRCDKIEYQSVKENGIFREWPILFMTVASAQLRAQVREDLRREKAIGPDVHTPTLPCNGVFGFVLPIVECYTHFSSEDQPENQLSITCEVVRNACPGLWGQQH